MQTYELLVRNRSIVPNSQDMTLVRTSIGIDQVHVLFDSEEWLDFPILATFSQGDDTLTVPLDVHSISDVEGYVAEATVTVPFEVVDMTGGIRVTFQGTSSDGRHIITARSAPMSVEEAGDVEIGEPPEGSPVVEQWLTAYANALQAVEDANAALDELRQRIQDIAAEDIGFIVEGLATIDDIPTKVSELENDSGFIDSVPIATTSSAGAVKPDGTTITVDQDGTIHGASDYELPVATTSSIGGVKPDGTTISVGRDGTIAAIGSNVPIATTSVPGKVMPDGTTITVDQDGTIHGVASMDIDTMRFGYVGNSSYTSYAAIIGDDSDRSYTFPNCTYVPSSAFYYYGSIEAADFPHASGIGSSAFYNCTTLSEISLPVCTYIGMSAFYRCTKLMSVDLTGVSSVPALFNYYAFYGTPIYSSVNGTYGSIYVPTSLYSAFRSASQWSYFSSRMVSV